MADNKYKYIFTLIYYNYNDVTRISISNCNIVIYQYVDKPTIATSSPPPPPLPPGPPSTLPPSIRYGIGLCSPCDHVGFEGCWYFVMGLNRDHPSGFPLQSGYYISTHSRTRSCSTAAAAHSRQVAQ